MRSSDWSSDVCSSDLTFRTRALMKAQAAKGWAVAGVTGVRQPDSGGKTGADGETVDGLTFYRTPSIAPVRSPIREWREIGALASRIEALVRAWQPDLLHADRKSPRLNSSH